MACSKAVWIFCFLFILQHHKAFSFLLRPVRTTVPKIAREDGIYCQDVHPVECWELRRLSFFHPSSTSTRLCSTEQETEPLVVNGNSTSSHSNGFSVNLTSSSHDLSTINGAPHHANGHSQPANLISFDNDEDPIPDSPTRTANGGYTHTKASRAKIGAANKGKTPWNKGKARSEEVRARIAAGVRARNRERFLKKLEDMGVTEEEYEAEKKEERRKKDAERRARRTEKGGYRPTEETKAKISKILKEKFARGEIKPRSVDPSKVRRGFTHSEETRRKISESLKKRWAEDDDYRTTQRQKVKNANSKEDVRKKISESLKAKWKDPVFREEMLNKMSNRKAPERNGSSYRDKISRAMKKKWQDSEYREKATQAMQKRAAEDAKKRPTKRVVKKKSPPQPEILRMVQPLARSNQKKKLAEDGVQRVKKVKVKGEASASATLAKPRTPKVKGSTTKTKKAPKMKKKKKEPEPDGSVNRLREERRDLFDLLYGDENGGDDDCDDNDDNDMYDPSSGGHPPLKSTIYALGDEDLDAFDPYGLDDY